MLRHLVVPIFKFKLLVALCWAGMLDMQPTDSPSALVNLTSLDTVLVAESLMYRLIDVRPEPDAQKSNMLRAGVQAKSGQHSTPITACSAQPKHEAELAVGQLARCLLSDSGLAMAAAWTQNTVSTNCTCAWPAR
jgi:hypothetical protein